MQPHEINILVIDDDKDVCAFLKKFLTEDGYNINTLAKPDRALDRIKEKTYHLIILDLKMPRIRGEDLLTEIRKVNPDISVIILTAHPSVDSAVQTMKNNAFDYIKKPFKVDELRGTIRSALRAKMLLTEREDELNIKIGRKVRGLRSEKGLTIKELAERANLSISLISQIERAESAASISTLNKIAIALNTELREFFE
ncbi:MAG: response regulator [Candidatus Scalindua sp.]